MSAAVASSVRWGGSGPAATIAVASCRAYSPARTSPASGISSFTRTSSSKPMSYRSVPAEPVATSCSATAVWKATP